MRKYLLFIVFSFFFLSVFSQEQVKSNDINRRFDPLMFPEGITVINVYSKKECGRCDNFREMLISDSITFNQFDLNDPAIYSEIDTKVNKSLPYKELGYGMGFPIVELNGIVFFNIENHHDFAIELIKFLKSK